MIEKPQAHDMTASCMFYEYSKAANPDLPLIHFDVFSSARYRDVQSQIIPWDLSSQLNTAFPATTPALLVNFVRIKSGEFITTHSDRVTSQLFYVIHGKGTSTADTGVIKWSEGDILTLPSNSAITHHADEDTAFYWVHDGPLLSYLGVKPDRQQFRPSHFRKETLLRELQKIRSEDPMQLRNRMGIILGNIDTQKTKTITHTMWSLLNVITPGSEQKPHRHNSVALDLCLRADPGTYTLMSKELSANGKLLNPIRADWTTGSAFITPPGWWHSHHNESKVDAYVFPVQDAGLHTYLRTLDIQFTK